MPFRARSALLLLCAAAMLAVGVRHEPAARPAAFPEPVRADSGMVVSAHARASEAGVAMLRQGGNAIDAAVATGFALAVVYPAAGNLGGGGFMVLRLADSSSTTIDHREKAPLAATRDMFLDARGNAVPERSREGHLASGVPGTPAGLLMAHERYGQLPLEEVIDPAIRLAEEGVRLSRAEANRLNRQHTVFLKYPGSRRYFVKEDSTARFKTSELFVQKDLAETLKRIRDEGRAGFYAGETARLIAEEMERGGGLITEEDLAEYEAVERAPVASTYRGYRVLGMRPPSSGGVAVAQLLNAVEPYDIEAMGYGASQTVHLMGEVMRRVYSDRAEWLGDADFVDVPTDALTDKEYMRRRMTSFNPYRADTSAAVEHGNPLAYESAETTHYSVVDNAGNAVSVTTTINGLYGSKVAVPGAGFFLNNEMDDFAVKPGVPNMYGLVGSEANAVAAEKRMLSSMAPTIVEDPEGRLFMVIGTPGGSTIITTVFQVILNVIDHGMDIQEAVGAARVHHQWLPDQLWHERYGMARDVERALEQRGWTVAENGTWGRADGITVRYPVVQREAQNGAARDTASALFSGANAASADTMRVYLGGADPRGEDVALGF